MGKHRKGASNDDETGGWADEGGWFPRWFPTMVTVLALSLATVLVLHWLVTWLS